MTTIFAVVNQKGGVGKTTTAVNLSSYLAHLGKKVLLIDLDPQGNATTGVGIEKPSIVSDIYDVLMSGKEVREAVMPTTLPNLSVLPSTVRLAGAEVELVPLMARESILRNAIAPLKDDFDYVLMDCPPSLGLLTVNALTAATDVLVPIQCEYYALEGLSQLVKTLDLIRKHLNADLKVGGIVLTMHDARTILSQQVADEARRYFHDKIFTTVIPRNVRLSEAPGFGKPILLYDPYSKGAEAYYALAKEVLGDDHQSEATVGEGSRSADSYYVG